MGASITTFEAFHMLQDDISPEEHRDARQINFLIYVGMLLLFVIPTHCVRQPTIVEKMTRQHEQPTQTLPHVRQEYPSSLP